MADIKMPVVKVRDLRLEGKRLYLRLLSAQDISVRYLGWLNDPVVVKYMRHRSRRTTMKDLADFVHSRQWPNDLTLAIIDKGTDLHIGNIGLTAIDWLNKKAELGMLLGDRDFWNKGYMSEAFLLVTRYAFATLKLHKLYAGTEEDNKSAVALFKKMGWQTEGRLKDEMLRNGRYVDVIKFAIFNGKGRG